MILDAYGRPVKVEPLPSAVALQADLFAVYACLVYGMPDDKRAEYQRVVARVAARIERERNE